MASEELKTSTQKDGYHFVHVDDNIVKQVLPVEIEGFVHNFLKERQAPIPLRDLVYGQQLSVTKLNKLDTFNVDFSSEDKEYQYMFFSNAVLKISAEELKLVKKGEKLDKYIWESKRHEHNIFLEDKHFTISKDKDGNDDIIVHRQDNMYLNFLTNASRVHWRKELEDSIENLKPKAKAEYLETHKFSIAGPNLSKEEQYEQKLHLINKILCHWLYAAHV